jgi:hypothetical protein
MQQKHEFTGGFVMKVVGKFCYLLTTTGNASWPAPGKK